MRASPHRLKTLSRGVFFISKQARYTCAIRRVDPGAPARFRGAAVLTSIEGRL
jgi:hypothetical protein